MASKLLFTRIRTLTRPLKSFTHPNFELRMLIQTRQYSDAALPAPIDPAHAPSLVASANFKRASQSSFNESELKKFSAIAETWWDAEGPFKPLHVMNPSRLAFIRSTLCRYFRKDPNCARPFEGLKFLDVGCGGGILSEPLACMGASVMGIDAVEKNIKITQLHAYPFALKCPCTQRSSPAK
ncbi:ubiquinone biosynthesis O-methyltransferase, mitochondrial-like isoform X2 [Olea europaea var. sylvestris]|uniref:ubiquinone biosynthesis O-methyltransferase, mitochondrial-like isoform X2 n=1 Tax=Olea europaea var. sylvestris TaxID=158386 RepID=UPI000C1D2CF6|nr:ubiquinone biosynthesis O-methyltransferase, mitochondrial-like isoform X2 [Olea europaea var. sylvestris]